MTGATGNVGVALLRALDAADEVEEVVGIARRDVTPPPSAKVRLVAADVVKDDLVPHFRGCDAVVHLAWQIQPMRDRERLRTVNVDGSARVFAAAAEAGAKTLVHASSIGTYRAAPRGLRVREDWPSDGIPTSQYSVDKAACERLLDRFEVEHPEVRVVRLRKAIVLQREAAGEQLHIFAGRLAHLVPRRLVGRGLPAVLPLPRDLRLQVVHADDAADAYVRAVLREDARGAYNIAAEPVLGPRELAKRLGAMPVPVPARVMRAAVDAAYRLHLQPTEVGWFDLGMETPLMDWSRAERDLGWRPGHRADAAVDDLLRGIRGGATDRTPPLRV